MQWCIISADLFFKALLRSMANGCDIVQAENFYKAVDCLLRQINLTSCNFPSTPLPSRKIFHVRMEKSKVLHFILYQFGEQKYSQNKTNYL
jgi:hypothetical protein